MTVRLTPENEAEENLWRLTAELCALLAGVDWVLIGGQMVALIEAELGGTAGRFTTDVDVLVNAGGLVGSPRDAAARLTTAGFTPEVLTDEIAYRFVRGTDTVDVLAPDHIGPRADTTTVPPARTHSIPGGRQALRRRHRLQVSVGYQTFEVPLPSLAGAVVIKAHAAAGSGRADRDLRDLARLLSVIPDPGALAADLTPRERHALRRLDALRNPQNPAWRGIANAEDGALAFLRISGTP